jgi:hypothetical protein
MFLELSALIRNKFYHADARRKNFCQLVDYIKCYNVDPSAHKIAIEHITEQFAQSLGHEYEPALRKNAYLKTRDWVDERTSTFSWCCCTPRSSFTAGKKREALRDAPKRAENSNWPLHIDTDKARNPPPDTEGIPKIQGDTEVVSIKGLATRKTLRPLDIGQGPWGIKDVLSDEGRATLLASLERANEALQDEVRTIADNATFMGETLSDSDDEVKEKESNAVDETGEKVDDQQELVLPSDEKIMPRNRSREGSWEGSRRDHLRKRARLDRRV